MSAATSPSEGTFDFSFYRFPERPIADHFARNWLFVTSSFLFIVGCLAASTSVIQHPTSIRHFVPRTFVGGIESGSEH